MSTPTDRPDAPADEPVAIEPERVAAPRRRTLQLAGGLAATVAIAVVVALVVSSGSGPSSRTRAAGDTAGLILAVQSGDAAPATTTSTTAGTTTTAGSKLFAAELAALPKVQPGTAGGSGAPQAPWTALASLASADPVVDIDAAGHNVLQLRATGPGFGAHGAGAPAASGALSRAALGRPSDAPAPSIELAKDVDAAAWIPSADRMPSRIAAVTNGNLVVLDAADGHVVLTLATGLAPPTGEFQFALSPSADGAMIYYSRFRNVQCDGRAVIGADIDRVPVAGGASERVVEEADNPKVSPDGRSLAYTSPWCTNPHVLVVRDLASGTERYAPPEMRIPRSWAADSRSLIASTDFAVGVSRSLQLAGAAVVDAGGAKLTVGSPACCFMVGTRVVAQVSNTSATVAPTPAPTTVPCPTPASPTTSSTSSTSEPTTTSASTGGAGGAPAQSPTAAQAPAPTLSPSASTPTAPTAPAVSTTSTTTSTATTTPCPTTGPRLVLLDPVDGHVVRVVMSNIDVAGPHSISVSPDGQTAYVARRTESQCASKSTPSAEIVEVSLRGTGEPRVITPAQSPYVSPDGKQLAYFASGCPDAGAAPKRMLAVRDLATGVVHTRDGIAPLAWSPDSQTIVARSYATQGIELIDAASPTLDGKPLALVGIDPIGYVGDQLVGMQHTNGDEIVNIDIATGRATSVRATLPKGSTVADINDSGDLLLFSTETATSSGTRPPASTTWTLSRFHDGRVERLGTGVAAAAWVPARKAVEPPTSTSKPAEPSTSTTSTTSTTGEAPGPQGGSRLSSVGN